MSDDLSSISVRRVRADEYAELRDVRLSARAYSDHFAEHLTRESVAPLSFWRDRARRGATGATMAFVAVGPGGFAGVVDGFMSEHGETLEIGGMWVSPSRRRGGIGGALLGAVCDWARERGAKRAGLWVRASNAAARLMYESEGFEPVTASCESGGSGVRLERRLS